MKDLIYPLSEVQAFKPSEILEYCISDRVIMISDLVSALRGHIALQAAVIHLIDECYIDDSSLSLELEILSSSGISKYTLEDAFIMAKRALKTKISKQTN